MELENINIQKSINSVLGWIPYIKGKTVAIIYNFFSQNYSIRKNFILRASLVKKQEIVEQKNFLIKPNSIIEISEIFFSKNVDAEILIIELFNPQIKKNHGGHNGHLRFWGKYRDNDDNFISTSHSMPLKFGINYINKEDLSRSYVMINEKS